MVFKEHSFSLKHSSRYLGHACLPIPPPPASQADGTNGLHSLNTLQYLTLARAVRNFPVINHGRCAGGGGTPVK